MSFSIYNMLINPLNELSHSTSYMDIISSILLMIVLYSIVLLFGYVFFKGIFWFFDHIFLKENQGQGIITQKCFIPKHLDMTPIFLYSYSGVTQNMVEPIEVDDMYKLEIDINGYKELISVEKPIFDKYNIGDTCPANYSQCVISKKIEDIIVQ